MRELKFEYTWLYQTGEPIRKVFTLDDIEKPYGEFNKKDFLRNYPITMIKRQFTGLQDKDGIDIYEGDIVTDGRQQDDHISAGVQEVEFQSGAFSPFAVAGWECVMDERKCEVIGNIHENPELLTPN